MKTISIIVPCHNESAALPHFYHAIDEVSATLKKYHFEFLFVDDGSTDDTLADLKRLHAEDTRVRYLAFSRNFGKESAMLAGLEHATGDYVAIMDADLQDPPSLLPEMVKYLESGDYDTVATRRSTRAGEPPVRSFFARLFYKLINKMSKVEMVDGARDYRLMTRQVVTAILSCPEYNRYSKGLWSFVGFRTKWLSYENVARVAGKTNWSFWQLFSYAIEGIVAFTTLPLTLSALFGILFCLIAFIIIIVIIIKTLIFGDPVSGWPSLVCIIMFVSGVQLMFLGIIGEYLAKTYLETKHRPPYIIRESTPPADPPAKSTKSQSPAHEN